MRSYKPFIKSKKMISINNSIGKIKKGSKGEIPNIKKN